MMRPTEVPVWASQPRYRIVWPGVTDNAAQRTRDDARLAAIDYPTLHVIRCKEGARCTSIVSRFGDIFGSKHASADDLMKRLNMKMDIWNGYIASDFPKGLNYLPRYNGYPPSPVVVPPEHPRPPGAGPRGPQADSAGAVWGGWACGAVVLALIVLLVRAAEKCVDKRLFHSRRRRSQEWPEANVRATNLQQQNDPNSFTNLDPSEFSIPTNPDLPPPYYECASNNVITNATAKNINKLGTEEPPPPYSECLVTFSNKDIPTVHIHGRHIDEPQTSSSIDNPNLMESSHRDDAEQGNYEEECTSVELVFNNGRIVERSGDEQEIVAREGDAVPASVERSPGEGCTTDYENVSQRICVV